MKPLLLFLIVYFGTATAVKGPCSPPVAYCECDEKILMCHEGILEIPKDFPENIVEIIIDGGTLNKLSGVDLPQVLMLSIINNAVSLEIEDNAFMNLTNLLTLHLESNAISALRKEMFTGLPKLTRLVLSENAFKEISEGTFEAIPTLESLELAGNDPLTLLPGSFSGLQKLVDLDLTECGLTEIPTDTLKELTALQTLELSKNLLEDVGNGLQGLNNLQELFLNGNGMKEISPEAFQGMKSLLRLNLENNRLKELDADLLAESWDSLRELCLAKNQLSTLDYKLAKWSQLDVVTLGNNPLNCDCENYWMKNLHTNFKENITCAAPEEFVGQDFHNVTLSLTQCAGDNSTVVMAVVIPLIIICVLLIAYFLYKLCQTRKRRGKKSVRYSAVYKDTVESVSGKQKGRPMSEL